MRVKFVTLNGNKFEVDIHDSASVKELKKKIAEEHNVGVNQIRLIFNGIAMTEDSKSIASYDVKNGTTVHMVMESVTTMNVTVQVPGGQSYTFTVEHDEQLEMFKEKIKDKTNYSVEAMELVFEGREINGGKMSHHSVKDGSRLQLRLKKVQVTVKTMNGKNITMEISATETVDQLKSRLYERLNVPVPQQQLVVNSRTMVSGRVLDYGVKCGSIINMVGRLRGG